LRYEQRRFRGPIKTVGESRRCQELPEAVRRRGEMLSSFRRCRRRIDRDEKDLQVRRDDVLEAIVRLRCFHRHRLRHAYRIRTLSTAVPGRRSPACRALVLRVARIALSGQRIEGAAFTTTWADPSLRTRSRIVVGSESTAARKLAAAATRASRSSCAPSSSSLPRALRRAPYLADDGPPKRRRRSATPCSPEWSSPGSIVKASSSRRSWFRVGRSAHAALGSMTRRASRDRDSLP